MPYIERTHSISSLQMRLLLRTPRLMWRRRVSSTSAPLARQFSTRNFELIDRSKPVEEETLPCYNPLEFYPVKIGDVFKSRYRVTGKLGYGMNATVWLCRDSKYNEYVTLKIGTSDILQNEVEVSRYLNSINTPHAGASLVRHMVDEFEITTNGRSYHGIIHAPLAATLESLRVLLPNKALPLGLLRAVLIHLLLALDFLHREAHIIHTATQQSTDIQAKNILLGMDSSPGAEDVCAAFEQRELEYPTPRKITEDGRVIHTSRRLVAPLYQYGRPVLSDFGEARFGKYNTTVTIQPAPYRSPEVMLGIPFTPKVDVWNVGAMISDLLGKDHLFKRAGGSKKEESDAYHLEHIAALLGPPPTELLKQAKRERSWEFLHEDGTWKGTNIPHTNLQNVIADWNVGDKAGFLRFIKKMLQWKPEDRSTPGQLLQDPWLNSDEEGA